MPLVNPIDIDDPAIEEMVKLWNSTSQGEAHTAKRRLRVRRHSIIKELNLYGAIPDDIVLLES